LKHHPNSRWAGRATWSRWSGTVTGYAARTDFHIVLGLFVVASALWIFIELAEEVMEGGTRAFDHALLMALRASADPGDPIGPGWLEEAVRDISALGSFTILVLIVVCAAGYLLMQGRRATALLLVVAAASGSAVSSALKIGFARPRPELVAHMTEVYTASFPSGHSTVAAVVYLTLGVLLARTQATTRARVYFMLVAILITLLVGVSRVYLGVHWPTDVLAGWTAGAGWAVMLWLVAYRLQKARRIETAGDEGRRSTESSRLKRET